MVDACRLKVATIHFDGNFVPWFQMLQKSGAISSWNLLANAIENTYEPLVYEFPLILLIQIISRGLFFHITS